MTRRRRTTATVKVANYYESDTRDSRGNRVKGWREPWDMDVYTIYPRTSTEPVEQGRQAVLSGTTVLAPIEFKGRINPHDRLILPDGSIHEVDGRPGNWEYNPHARTRITECIQIELTRAEG